MAKYSKIQGAALLGFYISFVLACGASPSSLQNSSQSGEELATSTSPTSDIAVEYGVCTNTTVNCYSIASKELCETHSECRWLPGAIFEKKRLKPMCSSLPNSCLLKDKEACKTAVEQKECEWLCQVKAADCSRFKDFITCNQQPFCHWYSNVPTMNCQRDGDLVRRCAQLSKEECAHDSAFCTWPQ